MGVMCQILIKKAREGVHRAGQPVTGIVRYAVDEPTEYQDVVLSFLGKGKCAWSERHGKTTSHYRGTEDYIVTHVNICDKRPDDTITLHGEYEYPFEFYLPEDIPRSFKDRICTISYVVQLKFEKPSFFSFNKVFTAEIPVYNYLTPSAPGPVIFGLDKTLFSWFAEKAPVINVKAQIEKTFFSPGENAHITWTVRNDTDVEILGVTADLHCCTIYTADCGRTKTSTDKVKSCEVQTTSIAERSVFEYTSVLPTLPELYSIDNSKVIKKEYRVRLTVILPLPHMNAKVEIPVLIGEQKGSIEPCVEVQEAEGEQPPSYWEAMSEDKEEKTEK